MENVNICHRFKHRPSKMGINSIRTGISVAFYARLKIFKFVKMRIDAIGHVFIINNRISKEYFYPNVLQVKTWGIS